MAAACTGVILAGGQNKRFGGQNKAFIRIGEKRIVDRLMDVFSRLFDQVVLVTNDPAAYMDVDALLVSDHFAKRSSLNGLHAGLFAAAHETAFFVACDTPFAREALIRCVLDHIEPKADIVIPSTADGFEPLFAVYRKSCLPAMANQLERDRLKIQGLFRKVRLKAIDEAELRQADPELISFFNINTPEDLKMAESLRTKFEKEH
ncbi:putative molybdenum cofactor guanylyltransferase [Desulfosarcina widdelii]|uniref:Probable molybdenum cofactor guanylyltransferase n=1 Tax=Desulfosarcina widdelii TaxID=947919 RepID=A0A5K7ZE90_9BACT|nr:molybdenum cofactor guanylyltransferase [Desulfosarcina widdelii]BBO76734.1 putative molybdenum cofactor guanylyltransferase [Desulfosarcina widdelii]